MKKFCLVLSMLLCTGASWGAGTPLLTPVPQRITDEAIAADIRVIESLQERLVNLNGSGVPIASYHFAKAQAWLDFALDEYTENDRSRVVEEALGQALHLIQLMERRAEDIPADTPIIPSSEMIRPDLWEKAGAFKHHANFRCAGDRIAQLEVQLVWAGHEYREMGWRHAKPYLQAAERLAAEAEDELAACPPLTAAPEGTAPPSFSSPFSEDRCSSPENASMNCADTALPFASTERPPLPDRVHFALNSAAISGASAAVLDRIAAAMKAEPTLHVTLRGHADQRGTSAYNLNLSRLRAERVRSYLAGAGIAADRITITAFGKARPLTSDTNEEGYARNRRVEFLYTIEDSRQIVPQDDDLQPKPATGQGR